MARLGSARLAQWLGSARLGLGVLESRARTRARETTAPRKSAPRPRVAPAVPAAPTVEAARDESATGSQAVAEVLAAALNSEAPTRSHLSADRAAHAVKAPVAAADAVDAFRAKVKALRSA